MFLVPAFIRLPYSSRLVCLPAGSAEDSNRSNLAISSCNHKYTFDWLIKWTQNSDINSLQQIFKQISSKRGKKHLKSWKMCELVKVINSIVKVINSKRILRIIENKLISSDRTMSILNGIEIFYTMGRSFCTNVWSNYSSVQLPYILA